MAGFPAPLLLLYRLERGPVLAKIAVKSASGPAQSQEQNVSRLSSRLLAAGKGWRVRDVICTAGPRDRAFEEQHTKPSIAIVVAGTFQYRSHASRELMTPGSLLLGNAGQYFECGHEHAAGDRCLSFEYEPEYFESTAAEAGASRPWFGSLRVPPVRELSAVVARALALEMFAGDGSCAEPGRSIRKLQQDMRFDRIELWEEVGL